MSSPGRMLQDSDGVVGWLDFEGWWLRNGGSIDGVSIDGDSLRQTQKRSQQGRLGACCARPPRETAVQRQSERLRSATDKDPTPVDDLDQYQM